MPGRGEMAELIDILSIGADSNNRKEIEESFEARMKEIFNIPDLESDPRKWDQETKYKVIIAHCSRDRYLRDVRNKIPAVFSLIEIFLQSKREFEERGAKRYLETVSASIDILLNEIYMRAYPDYSRDPELSVEKIQSKMGNPKAAW